MTAYASASDVAVLCQQLLANQEMFTESTSPTRKAVDAWISSGCAFIEGRLSTNGYSVPPASTSVAWGVLKQLNAYYGAAMAEMSRSNVILASNERTRGQVYMELFEKGLASFLSVDQSLSGLSRSATGKLYAGGISVADKDSRVDDTDRVKPRFYRGVGRFPGTVRPDEESSED